LKHPDPTARRRLSLRSAMPDDIPLIAKMHAQSWASTYRGMLPDAYLDHDVHEERAAYWQARIVELAAGSLEVLIAEHDGNPSASCA
jgi:hypothetical protein